jgi:hypothetical protein
MNAVEFHPKLQCGLIRFEYDTLHQSAILFLPHGHCTNMFGAIDFVKKMFPDVRGISTIPVAGKGSLARHGIPRGEGNCYTLRDGAWEATRLVFEDSH